MIPNKRRDAPSKESEGADKPREGENVEVPEKNEDDMSEEKETGLDREDERDELT
jgi:hypothetical protein